jgi:hypothetical protein
VLVAVPFYGIAERGFREYLRQYIQPSIIMLPFNIIGEASRTLALRKEFNETRQAAITEEILEIATAVEVLNNG